MASGKVFFGWRVVTASFLIATFAWGVSFYGPPVFLYVIHDSHGWPIATVSAAITCHYLAGALFVMNIASIHRRFGLMPVTIIGSALTGLGFVGWSAAFEPWHLFALTPLTGLGWAATGGAAINAMVAPWFVKRRPVALSMAYNGASMGGIVFSTLWVVLIGSFGFLNATIAVGVTMFICVTLLAIYFLATSPAEMQLPPDGCQQESLDSDQQVPINPPLPGAALYSNKQFVTLSLGMSLGLFAQIGLLAHLYSLLVPALGEAGAGGAISLATVCAVVVRMILAWLISPAVDRRIVAVLGYVLQIIGCLAFIFAAGQSVALLLIGVTLFGSGIGNATSVPPLIAQVEFTPNDTARVVALIMGISQSAFAFAPAAFGLLRDANLTSGGDVLGGSAPILFLGAAIIQLLAIGCFLTGCHRQIVAQ